MALLQLLTATVTASVSGTRTTPSLVYVAIEGRAPTERAACSQRTAESEPVTARLGPRSSPSSSANGCVGVLPVSRTVAGRLFKRSNAAAPIPATAQTSLESSSLAGPCQRRANVPV